MVNIYIFSTNSNDQIPNNTAAKIQLTLDPLINTPKLEEARYIDFETILEREFQRCDKWISANQLPLVGINLINFYCILQYYII